MTVYVIDTNALIFAFANSRRLTKPAAAALGDHGAVRVVSAASIYEITWKHRLGKLALDPADVRRGLRASGLEVRSTTEAVMYRAASLDWDHRDPWDRMIAAQAIDLEALLVSSDNDFDALEQIDRIW
ncbi:MAG: type II toxin-antitoxin system VapC family toxin [Pseudomonadota bacterium]